MGASLAGGGGRSGRRGRRRRGSAIVDLNMTPFIDVMLVLLIIFMVAAPMMTVGVPVELPRSAARPIQDETRPLTVSVNSRGEIYLQEMRISLDEVVPRLMAIAQNGVEDRIFIRGDRTVNYGLMMQVMGKISGAGFRRIGLVTEQDPNAPPPPAFTQPRPANAPAAPAAPQAQGAQAPRQAQR
jgi:biopolymer transport protein TolR